MRSRETSTAALAVLVGVAALGFWSCGGSYDSPTTPALVQDTEGLATPAVVQSAADEGGVTASRRHVPRKITICHKGKTLKVSFMALIAHLRHGDRLGPCTPPAVTCPCFTSEGLADMADQCSSAPIASCGDPYSLNLFCAASGGTGTIGNLGYFEARLGSNTCGTSTQDPSTGEEVTTMLSVTPAQFEACRQAIVGSEYYPPSCPQ
jgi:hypothetical protein